MIFAIAIELKIAITISSPPPSEGAGGGKQKSLSFQIGFLKTRGVSGTGEANLPASRQAVSIPDAAHRETVRLTIVAPVGRAEAVIQEAVPSVRCLVLHRTPPEITDDNVAECPIAVASPSRKTCKIAAVVSVLISTIPMHSTNFFHLAS